MLKLRKLIVRTISVFSTLFFLAFAKSAWAITFLPDTENLNNQGSDAIDLGSRSAITVTFSLINIGLSLLATLCLVIILYGGFLWIWARGNAETVTKAKDVLRGALLGLIIVLASFGITTFVFTQVGNITGAEIVTE